MIIGHWVWSWMLVRGHMSNDNSIVYIVWFWGPFPTNEYHFKYLFDILRLSDAYCRPLWRDSGILLQLSSKCPTTWCRAMAASAKAKYAVMNWKTERKLLDWYEKYDVVKGWKLPQYACFFGTGVQKCVHTCRPPILDLAERFQSAGDWASERVFNNWVNKQPWRKCLPGIYEFTVKRVTLLTLCIYSTFGIPIQP